MIGKYEYRGEQYTINELSDMSGIAPATIRYRLRQGYPLEEAIKTVATNESVFQFTEASWWEDWIGMPISGLFKIYREWCVSNGYTSLGIQGFSRQLMQLNPQLKTVPNRVDGECFRVIRER